MALNLTRVFGNPRFPFEAAVRRPKQYPKACRGEHLLCWLCLQLGRGLTFLMTTDFALHAGCHPPSSLARRQMLEWTAVKTYLETKTPPIFRIRSPASECSPGRTHTKRGSGPGVGAGAGLSHVATCRPCAPSHLGGCPAISFRSSFCPMVQARETPGRGTRLTRVSFSVSEAAESDRTRAAGVKEKKKQAISGVGRRTGDFMSITDITRSEGLHDLALAAARDPGL